MSYMAKYDARIRARKMRKNGISIITISKELNVSKGSVSLWCRDILLNSQQIEKLKKQKGNMLGRWIGAEANRKKKLYNIQEADTWGKNSVKKISSRELLLVIAALYWCEGSKTDSTSRFLFANSDPSMILLMKNALIKVIQVAPEDIVCCIQINKIHEKRIRTVLIFWKKLLKLNNSQMRKPYFVNTKISKVYDNYDTYFGVCRLFVRRSKNLKYRMLGLIKALKTESLSA